MILTTEPITEHSRFWRQIQALAAEAFPPEEYLAPERLVKMARVEPFDVLMLRFPD